MGKKRVKFNLQTASCGPCVRKAEADVKAASAFCKSCNDFLCTECIKPHRRLVAMENHQLINRDHVIKDTSDRDSMDTNWDEILVAHRERIADEIAKLDPDVIVKYEEFRKQTLASIRQDETDETDSFDDDIVPPQIYEYTEPCPEHHDQFIKHYCHSHDILCCDVCKILYHKHCLSNVKFLPDEVAESDGKFRVDPFKKINEQIDEFKEYDKNLQNDIRELKRSKEAFLQDVQVKKREILNWINLMEVRAVRRLEIVFDRCKRDLEMKRKRSKEAKADLRAESYFLKEIITDDNYDEVYKFIKSKKAEKVVDVCAKKRGHRKFTNTRFAMRVNPEFEKLKVDINQLYELKFETKGEDKYSVRLKDDKFVCNVTGCTFFPNGNIVVADRSNSKIKQFSSKFRQLSNIYIPGGVFDLSAISPNAVVASSPEKSKLHILEFQAEIEIAKSIDVAPGKCWGVNHNDGIFFVNISIEDAHFVRAVDLDGQVLFNTGTSNTFYSTYRVNDSDIVNSNVNYNIVTVTSFMEGSNIEVEYYLDELVDPENSMTLNQYNYLKHLHTKGVELDRHENVVVCCPDVDQIYTISKTGEEAELMLAESDGLCKPQSLAYNVDRTVLVVASENADFLQLFKFDV